MREIIWDVVFVVFASVIATFAVILLYIVVQMAPHSTEFYLRPYGEQVFLNVGATASFLAAPALAWVAWRDLYRSVVHYVEGRRKRSEA